MPIYFNDATAVEHRFAVNVRECYTLKPRPVINLSNNLFMGGTKCTRRRHCLTVVSTKVVVQSLPTSISFQYCLSDEEKSREMNCGHGGS